MRNEGGPLGSTRRVEFPLACVAVRPRPEDLVPRDPGAAPGAVPHVPESYPPPLPYPVGSSERYWAERRQPHWADWNAENRLAEARGRPITSEDGVLRARGAYTPPGGGAARLFLPVVLRRHTDRLLLSLHQFWLRQL